LKYTENGLKPGSTLTHKHEFSEYKN
jgi:hypothetical protein